MSQTFKKWSLRSLWSPLQFLVLGLFSLFITGYIFINGFELATTIDLPFAFALEPVPVADFIATNQSKAVEQDPKVSVGNFGEPQYLKIANQQNKLPLVASSKQENGTFVARAAAGHFLYLTPAKNGNLGTTLIYLREGWRTVNDPGKVIEGSNVFVDTTKEWRYMYRVDQVVHISASSPYIVPDNLKSQLVVIVTKPGSHDYQIILATFISLQNIQQ